MKRTLTLLAVLAATAGAHATDVGVSVTVGQPGFYGRIDIGNFPRPVLLYPQPVTIIQGAGGPPLYLHVPPGHAKDWAKHCRKYDACGRPVYFVEERWYNDVYVPRYRELHPGGPPPKARGDRGRGNDRDDDRRDDRHDDRGKDQGRDRKHDGSKGNKDDKGDKGDKGDRGEGRGRGKD